jgi:hypothetical protein
VGWDKITFHVFPDAYKIILRSMGLTLSWYYYNIQELHQIILSSPLVSFQLGAVLIFAPLGAAS